MISRSMIRFLAAFIVSALPLTAPSQELPLPVAEIEREEPIDFSSEILPILKQNCLACHHAKEAEGGLILETVEKITQGGDSGHGVVPGNIEESLLFTRAVGSEEPLMPPEDNSVGAKPLTPEQLGLLKRWIQEGGKAGQAKMVEAIKWQPIPETIRTVYSVDISPDGQFAVVGRGNRVIVIDLASHEIVDRLVDSTLDVGEVTDVDLIQSVAVSPDAERIATGGFRTVRLWRKVPGTTTTGESPLLNAAGAAAVHASEKVAALVNAIGDIEVWDLENNQLRCKLSGTPERITELLWAESADLLLSVDQMGRLTLWDLPNSEPLVAMDTGTPVLAAAISSDATKVAWIDSAKKTHLSLLSEDRKTWEQKTENLGGVSEATAIALIDQPVPMVIVAAGAGTISLIDAAGNKVVRKFEHGAVVDALAVTADQTKLITGGRDGRSQLWNLADGKSLMVMQGDTQQKLRLANSKRDADRQKTTMTRLTQKSETLKKLLEKEDEALKKVTEEHKKAMEALAGEEKKRADAVALVAMTQAKIEKASTDTAAAKKTGESAAVALKESELQKEQIAIQIKQQKIDLAAMQASAVTAEQQAAAATKAMNEAKAQAARIQKLIDEANAKLKKASDDAAVAKKQIEDSNKVVSEAKAISEKSSKDLETQKKAVDDAETAKAKSESELAKRKQALDTASAAQQRATAALPQHELVIKAEANRQVLLDKKLAEAEAVLSDAASAVSDLTTDANGNVVTAYRDGSVHVYRSSDGVPLAGFRSDDRNAFTVATVGNAVFGFAPGLPVEQWSTESRWVLDRTLGSIDDPTVLSDRVTALDFHPDGLSVAVGSGPPSRSGEIKVFDVRNGRVVRDFGDVHSDTVLGLAFSPNGRTLASSAADKTIRLLDLARGELVRSLEGHTHHVLSIAWQDDGQTIASASADQTLKVWNVETGEQRRTISGFAKEITAVSFLQSTNQVMTACADGQVRLYDTANGKSLRSFNASGDFLYTLSVTPDGSELVAGGQSGKVRFWNVKDAKIVRELE